MVQAVGHLQWGFPGLSPSCHASEPHMEKLDLVKPHLEKQASPNSPCTTGGKSWTQGAHCTHLPPSLDSAHSHLGSSITLQTRGRCGKTQASAACRQNPSKDWLEFWPVSPGEMILFFKFGICNLHKGLWRTRRPPGSPLASFFRTAPKE